MPKVCILHGCKSSTKLGGVRFHRIPWKDNIRATIWVDFLVSNGTDRNRINANSRLCSRHFRQGETDPSIVSLPNSLFDGQGSELQGVLKVEPKNDGSDTLSSVCLKRETDTELGDQYSNTLPGYGTGRDSTTSSIKKESGPHMVVSDFDPSSVQSALEGFTTDFVCLQQNGCAEGDVGPGLSESDLHSKTGEELPDRPPHPARKKRGKSRKPKPGWEYQCTEKTMAVLSLKEVPSVDTTKMKTEQRRLSFINPGGKVKEQFDADTSVRATRKKERQLGSKSKPKSLLYDESGRLMKTHQDLCDCLVPDCPGCHFPCKVCGSEKCGVECRCCRRWRYDSITVEGTSLCFKWPVTPKDSK